MATGKPQYYWDTAPLIAWIKDEQRDDPSEMDGLADVIEQVEQGKAILMTSVLWRVEVLNDSLSPEQKQKLSAIFQNRYIQELAIDARVMDLASEIRNYHKSNQARPDVMKNIRTPDAIHLASAIHYEATEFHTLDGKKVDGTPKGLLTLSGNVAGHRLIICAPKAEQARLRFPNDDEQSEDEDSGE